MSLGRGIRCFMFSSHTVRHWLHPIFVWLYLLAAIFATEAGLMLLLPRIMPVNSSRIVAAAVDAVVLTLLLAPLLWWTLVRPLQAVIRMRARFLVDLFTQIEQDRRQTAYELHDGVGQSLTLLVSGLRSARNCRDVSDCHVRFEDFERLALNSLTEVRRLAMGLRPSLLDDLGLAPALERLAEDCSSHHPIRIEVDIAQISHCKLPERASTAIFRIVQEALTNIVKHSNANVARVCVRRGVGNFQLEITDDGRGFEAALLEHLPAAHLGLRGMRERTMLLGGTFSIESTPGAGTRLRAVIPAGEAVCG